MSSWCDQCQRLYDRARGCPECVDRFVEVAPGTLTTKVVAPMFDTDDYLKLLDAHRALRAAAERATDVLAALRGGDERDAYVRCAALEALRAALDSTTDATPWSAAAQPPITGESNAAGEYRTHIVQLRLCEGCLLGKGRECHTPSCALCWHDSPGMPIHPELYLIVEREP